MDAEQLQQEWEAKERALIECAQAAWASEGSYPLHGWQLHSMTAIVGYGTPTRARHEYQHVFLFEKGNFDGTIVRLHLRSIGKAPWHASAITWRGTQFTSRTVHFRSYPRGEWTIP